jgi:glycosyltransferase involved in cell wall biosynthesis
MLEREKTKYCLDNGGFGLFFGLVREFLFQPFVFLRELLCSVRAGTRNEFGYLRNFSYFVEAAYLMPMLRLEKVDHVHAHFASASTSVARIVHRLGGPSYSFTGHGRIMFDSPHSLNLMDKIAEATFVVGVCDYTAAQLKRWSPADQWAKIHVVRCTVADRFFDRAEAISDQNGHFVCVGRLSEEKGQLLLLKAFANLHEDFPDATCTFVGHGNLRNTLVAMASELGISNKVHFAGALDEKGVSAEILKSRTLIVPSFMEGLPVVIMEAFALGRPVIASCISGIPELVVPSENGWLVPAGNEDRLESAMRSALTLSLDDLNNMGRHGMELVRQNHSVKTEAARLDRLFQCYSSRIS